MADQVMALLIAAAILVIGFLANILFKKTGWPEILLLIIIGIIIGPVLNLLPQESFLPALPLISTFTLLMVLFRGGMELNVSEVVSGSARGLLQAGMYFALGVLFVTVFLAFRPRMGSNRKLDAWVDTQPNWRSGDNSLG